MEEEMLMMDKQIKSTTVFRHTVDQKYYVGHQDSFWKQPNKDIVNNSYAELTVDMQWKQS